MRMVLAATLFAVSLGIASAGMRVVIDDVRFPEGPVWHEGNLYFAEYGGDTIMSWDGEGKPALFWAQDGCGPSAIAVLPDGTFLVACYDSDTLVHLSAKGKVLGKKAESVGDIAFVGLNDIAVGEVGGAYFTASGPWESEPIVGRIFYRAPDGLVREVANDLHYPNGVVLSADGDTLFVAESEAYRIIRFDVAENGELANRRLFVRMNALLPDAPFGQYPDGIKLGPDGNLWVGHYSAGRIAVVSPEGTLVRTIEVPSEAAPNLAFGPDGTVYVTAVDDTSAAPWPGKIYAVTPD